MDPEELKLERQRLAIETKLRRAELKLQRHQFEANRPVHGGWKALLTPTGAAIAAAVIGICGTAASKWFDLRIEKQKQETNVILKASEVPEFLDETSRSVQRARNLLWFAEAGYVSLPERFVEQLRIDALLKKGQTPPAPAVQTATSGTAMPVAKKTFFESGMRIDVSGAYHAFHPDPNAGLDSLRGDLSEVVTDSSGHPITQGPTDPAPGYYVSITSLQDGTKPRIDPRRYVNSEEIPYVELPPGGTTYSLGDICACYSRITDKLAFAIFADVGPSFVAPAGNKSPQGSIALANALGVPSNAKTGGTETNKGILYLIFPQSGDGKPKTSEEIRAIGTRLLEQWGGLEKLKKSSPE